jgi:fatty acid desaturase
MIRSLRALTVSVAVAIVLLSSLIGLWATSPILLAGLIVCRMIWTASRASTIISWLDGHGAEKAQIWLPASHGRVAHRMLERWKKRDARGKKRTDECFL